MNVEMPMCQPSVRAEAGMNWIAIVDGVGHLVNQHGMCWGCGVTFEEPATSLLLHPGTVVRTVHTGWPSA